MGTMYERVGGAWVPRLKTEATGGGGGGGVTAGSVDLGNRSGSVTLDGTIASHFSLTATGDVTIAGITGSTVNTAVAKTVTLAVRQQTTTRIITFGLDRVTWTSPPPPLVPNDVTTYTITAVYADGQWRHFVSASLGPNAPDAEVVGGLTPQMAAAMGGTSTTMTGYYRYVPFDPSQPQFLVTRDCTLSSWSVYFETVPAGTVSVALFVASKVGIYVPDVSATRTAVQGWNRFPVNMTVKAGDRLAIWVADPAAVLGAVSGSPMQLQSTSGAVTPSTKPTAGGNVFTSAQTVSGALPLLYAETTVNRRTIVTETSPVKEPVRCALTSLTASLSGLLTPSDTDGVTLAVGDRVLVPFKGAQNGIYIAQAGAWTRAPDADTWGKLVGAQVYVSHGTQMGGYVVQSRMGSLGTLGSSSIEFDMELSRNRDLTSPTTGVLVGKSTPGGYALQSHLGSGTHDSTTALFGDQTYKKVPKLNIYGRIQAEECPSGVLLTNGSFAHTSDNQTSVSLLTGWQKVDALITGATQSSSLRMSFFSATSSVIVRLTATVASGVNMSWGVQDSFGTYITGSEGRVAYASGTGAPYRLSHTFKVTGLSVLQSCTWDWIVRGTSNGSAIFYQGPTLGQLVYEVWSA